MGKLPSVNELYQAILSRQALPLPSLEDALIEKAWERANRIHAYLEDRADRLEEDCFCCDRKARESQTRYVYDTPWEDEESEKRFCSEECADQFLYGGDFAYQTCQKCEREICQQNPANGWHWQFRDYDGDDVCLRCYESLILENGVEREKLEKGKLPGMFFSTWNLEPLSAGYREVQGFTNFFVNSDSRADRLRKKALELMDQGKKVVIGYERMAIGGGEGYVTLMEKDPERSPTPRKRAARPKATLSPFNEHPHSVKGSRRRYAI